MAGFLDALRCQNLKDEELQECTPEEFEQWIQQMCEQADKIKRMVGEAGEKLKWTDDEMRKVCRELYYPMSLIPGLPQQIERVYGRVPTYEEVFEDIKEGRLSRFYDGAPYLPYLVLDKKEEQAPGEETKET